MGNSVSEGRYNQGATDMPLVLLYIEHDLSPDF